MRSKALDWLAKWSPAAIVPPRPGKRCPRCHASQRRQPCQVCNPQPLLAHGVTR